MQYLQPRAASAGYDEGVRAFDHRNAIVVQRQQGDAEASQVVQVAEKRPVYVDDNVAATPPHQPLIE